MYLYCKFTYLEANKENTTEFIKLSSDINKIIESGTVFDEISAFDENGQIT